MFDLLDDMESEEKYKLWEKRLKQRIFVVDALKAAEMHWFFVQGFQAIWNELYIPGVLSLINGVEASLRFTLCQLKDPGCVEPDNWSLLNNKLISAAQQQGLPIEALAFPDENDFLLNLASRSPVKSVKIVTIRNDVCHGNLSKFVNHDLGEDNLFLTPECLRDLSGELIELSMKWVKELGGFRAAQFSKKVF